MAATPVGATTAIFLGQCSLTYFKKVVFPGTCLTGKENVAGALVDQPEREVEFVI
jgi:hypothetical protein